MPLSQISDDLIHVPEANSGWRESYYFDFYDPVLGIGMWHSVGKRPHKGHSGYALGAWGLHTLAGIGRDHFSEHTEQHLVGGMRYECIEPLKQWRTTFNGDLGMPTPQRRLDVRSLLPEGQVEMPRVPVQFDLTFTGISPAYTYRDLPVWKPLFSGHLDQLGRTTGTLTIGDQTYAIDGVGGRDRSWGTRDWAYPRMWRFIDLVGDGFNLTHCSHGSRPWHHDGRRLRPGWFGVHAGGRLQGNRADRGSTRQAHTQVAVVRSRYRRRAHLPH